MREARGPNTLCSNVPIIFRVLASLEAGLGQIDRAKVLCAHDLITPVKRSKREPGMKGAWVFVRLPRPKLAPEWLNQGLASGPMKGASDLRQSPHVTFLP